ncbi:AraC family ligand binding domain-containing protein, partial [Achromobacter xylosoxidans]|uniref:AraC family ligand binding domain-containing protein n=1 Tax=Alcaligenes xylosoxydans xylosoxydans TaxID=85698 RepID=UPI0015C5C892
MTSGQFVMQRSALAGVQAVAAHSRHAFARHTHEQFGIGVMRQGAQVSHSGRGQVEAGPGHVITVNPGEVHDGAPIGDAGRAWQMLYLDPEVVAQAAAELGSSGQAYEFEHPAQDRPALARDVLALYAQATAGAAPLACEALLLRILAQARDRD